MKKILVILLVVCIPAIHVTAQKFPLGIFDGQTEIGKAKKGMCKYNAETQQYSITGSGTNIWATHDEFQFLYKKMSGDFMLTSNAAFVGKGVEEHRKWGWMVRQSLDTSSPHVNAVVHGDGLTSLQFRRTAGATTEEQKSAITHADVVRLERKGNRYYMSAAKNGELFTIDSLDLDLGNDVYVGLFVCSHNNTVAETAVFHNVRITIPAPATLVPYRQYLGSQLEIMDVATATSKIIFQSPRSIQAPNYMPGGNQLIYNSDGLIYKFDLKTLIPSVLNTGSIAGNNNDHVISFDGKMLGISSNNKEDNASKVYTLPLSGGEPKQITPTGPSYLHGWSIDGKYLVFVGLRNDDYDIYKVPSTGGEEVNLTNSKGLDDGCEYSPNGKYIYFNSVRNGLMQVYRMKPDGSNVEQLTNDSLNNWFAHPSPDGKWIAFISFGLDVNPSDHPFYKHVYIRLMPANGGTPRAIAYLYGGQGTINTPCWSPDSKRIAFISNSNLLSEVYPIEKK